jgi:RNA-binding motif protein, X-linked 2
MNPITNMKNLNKMNDRELELGLAGTKNSWHEQVNSLALIIVDGTILLVLLLNLQ